MPPIEIGKLGVCCYRNSVTADRVIQACEHIEGESSRAENVCVSGHSFSENVRMGHAVKVRELTRLVKP